MTRVRSAVFCVAIAAAFAACAYSTVPKRSAAGDVEVNAFSPTRTVLVRARNAYPTQVHIFTIIGNESNDIADLATGGTQTVTLDPSLFPGTTFSLDIRPDSGPTKRLGPFHLSRGQTADLIVGRNLDSSSVTVVPTVP
jgi:hypothetical protein